LDYSRPVSFVPNSAAYSVVAIQQVDFNNCEKLITDYLSGSRWVALV